MEKEEFKVIVKILILGMAAAFAMGLMWGLRF